MKKTIVILILLLLVILKPFPSRAHDPKDPPLSEYKMPRDAVIVMARSAAPAKLSLRATIKALTASGCQIACDGDSGFVRIVMCSWSALTYTPRQFLTLVSDGSVATSSVARFHKAG
jgi:hypothetical protein